MSKVGEAEDIAVDTIINFSTGQPGFQELYGEYEEFVEIANKVDDQSIDHFP